MDAGRRHAALIASAFALASLGCEGEGAQPRRASHPGRVPAGAHVEELGPEALAATEPPPAIAERSASEVHARAEEAPRVISRAPATDAEYASDEPVATRRYVYRVQLAVPESLGANRSDLAIPAAELFVDVSDERLRARFVGPGWPVEAGSEIRLRGDSPGVYVFDRDGGRSLAPGEMSQWFEGGPRNRPGPPPSVRRDPLPAQQEVPGALICALLAEWTGEPREHFMRRCDRAAPMAFRVGFWRAERTADVPTDLPRRALRADEEGAPRPIGHTRSRAFLEPAALARVPRMERPPRDLPSAEPTIGEGLEVVNQGDARLVVTVEGVAIGWVDAGASGLFAGLQPGHYRVAALRPMGAVVARPRAAQVPGRTVFSAPRPARVEEGW